MAAIYNRTCVCVSALHRKLEENSMAFFEMSSAHAPSSSQRTTWKGMLGVKVLETYFWGSERAWALFPCEREIFIQFTNFCCEQNMNGLFHAVNWTVNGLFCTVNWMYTGGSEQWTEYLNISLCSRSNWTWTTVPWPEHKWTVPNSELNINKLFYQ